MALIPAGVYTIGNSIGDSDISNAIPTNVYVSAFYMDVNLVTYSQWQAGYDYATNQGYNFEDPGSGKGKNYPVEMVNWFDCVKWSNARSQQAGLTPVYYTDAGFTLLFTNGDSGTTVYANWGANGYRLPTEAEWEKAARGGLSGQRFPWGNTISWLQANYDSFPEGYDLGIEGFNGNFSNGGFPFTGPVGFFAPNGYGLYDMAGNVCEWCWDWYAPPPYPAGSPFLGGTDPDGPVGPVAPLNARVLRGGSWIQSASLARCAYRFYFPPSASSFEVGFRCVRGF
jgi:formylglycine-generating enzyme required for sulfatase activity